MYVSKNKERKRRRGGQENMNALRPANKYATSVALEENREMPVAPTEVVHVSSCLRESAMKRVLLTSLPGSMPMVLEFPSDAVG